MRFVFIITILCFTLFANARQQVVYDSSAVEQRNFAASSFDKYKTDRDFQYENEVVEMPSLWDRFWMWFWNK
ncbi:MAG TPA: hypothetical protein PLA68_10955, partial [Panacibacter sp.]|nr:hypothetical protein [Panacibacter sp.]